MSNEKYRFCLYFDKDKWNYKKNNTNTAHEPTRMFLRWQKTEKKTWMKTFVLILYWYQMTFSRIHMFKIVYWIEFIVWIIQFFLLLYCNDVVVVIFPHPFAPVFVSSESLEWLALPFIPEAWDLCLFSHLWMKHFLCRLSILCTVTLFSIFLSLVSHFFRFLNCHAFCVQVFTWNLVEIKTWHTFLYIYVYIYCVCCVKKNSIYAQPWIIMCLTAELAVSLEALIVALYEWNTYFTPIFQFSLWHFIVRCVPRLLNSPLHRRIWMGIWVTKSIASYAKHWLTMRFSI